MRSDNSDQALALAPSGDELRVAALIESLVEDPETLKDLVRWSLLNLRPGATSEDAEDSLHDFWIDHLPKVAATYKTGAQSFLSFVKLCLQRFCWRRGSSLRRRRRLERPLWQGSEHGDRALQLAETSLDSKPGGRQEQQADEIAWEAERSRASAALDRLSSLDREILGLFYEKGLAVIEIAARLAISESAAKVRLHRARKRLEKHLRSSAGMTR